MTAKKKRRTLDDFATTEETTSETTPEQPTPKESPTKTKDKKEQRMTAYMHLAVYEQLRKLAFDERVTMNSLLLEGLERVFTDRGLKGIDELQ